jgi:hypothetical protein
MAHDVAVGRHWHGQPVTEDRPLRERQIVEQMVTIGRALAGEV